MLGHQKPSSFHYHKPALVRQHKPSKASHHMSAVSHYDHHEPSRASHREPSPVSHRRSPFSRYPKPSPVSHQPPSLAAARLALVAAAFARMRLRSGFTAAPSWRLDHALWVARLAGSFPLVRVRSGASGPVLEPSDGFRGPKDAELDRRQFIRFALRLRAALEEEEEEEVGHVTLGSNSAHSRLPFFLPQVSRGFLELLDRLWTFEAALRSLRRLSAFPVRLPRHAFRRLGLRRLLAQSPSARAPPLLVMALRHLLRRTPEALLAPYVALRTANDLLRGCPTLLARFASPEGTRAAEGG